MDCMQDWRNGEPSALTMAAERESQDCFCPILANHLARLLEHWFGGEIATFNLN
jgi:hypothetical protein